MKHYFITGGTSGIGWELAQAYLKEGGRVAVCGRDLSKLPPEAKSDYPRLVTYQLDVTDIEAVENAVKDFAKEGLDVVVANAGISHGNKTQIPNADVTRKIFNINVLGVINTFMPALDIFLPQGKGQLVAVASVAGFVGLPGASAYSASKSAVIQLMESYSLDLRDKGIKTTTVCPGFIDTPLTKKNSHSMPFLLSLEEGAGKIKKAIDKEKVLYVFPWQMALVIHILRRMPRFLYRFVMSLPFANYSQKGGGPVKSS